MIDSKEQYLKYLDSLHDEWAWGKTEHIWETIEALREVARAARNLREFHAIEAWEDTVTLEKVLSALPDWIFEE